MVDLLTRDELESAMEQLREEIRSLRQSQLDSDRLMTAEQVAEYMQISREAVRALKHELKMRKIAGRLITYKSDIDAFIKRM